MKDEYVLYLDESEFKSSKTFAIAGIAVKKDDICILEQGLEEIKRLIWDEQYIIDNAPVLHCTELQKVFDNRRTVDILGVKEEYQETVFETIEQDYGSEEVIMRKALYLTPKAIEAHRRKNLV